MSTYEWVVTYRKLRDIFPKIYTLEYFESLKDDLLEKGDQWMESDQFQNYVYNLVGIHEMIAYLKGESLCGC